MAAAKCGTHNAGKEKTVTNKKISAARSTRWVALSLLDLASESSDARGRFKVQVLVLVFFQFEKFLIRIERLQLLSQFIVTSSANKPAAQGQCFSLGKYIQTLQRGGIIFVEVLRGNQVAEHVVGRRIHFECDDQLIDRLRIIFFLEIHMAELCGEVRITGSERDRFLQCE